MGSDAIAHTSDLDIIKGQGKLMGFIFKLFETTELSGSPISP